MAFLKRNQKAVPKEGNDGEKEKRYTRRGPGGLIEQLADPRPQVRRFAVRDLSAFPEAVPALLSHLKTESERVVQEVVFTSLQAIGGDAVVEGLVPYLKSEDAALRNGVIEVLQGLPDAVSGLIHTLLHDDDSDTRIFAVDILRELAHPQINVWLEKILIEEQNVNVCAAAVDCLSEVGTPDLIPSLHALGERFADVPFISFAVQAAVERIGQSH